uniref:Uncharacterized protein n=1 Tax=Anguilla anguilla TaxID=7936 RepID=A0A0E9UVK5_ANGAN
MVCESQTRQAAMSHRNRAMIQKVNRRSNFLKSSISHRKASSASYSF